MKTKNGRIAPTVNINGTEGTGLYQHQVVIIGELQSAAMALKLAAPHGRDYPDGDWDDAVGQHRLWMKLLSTVLIELVEVAEATRKQVENRE